MWFDELAVFRVDLGEGAGDGVADGDGLAVDTATFCDDVEVKLVDLGDGLEGGEDGVLQLDRGEVFLEGAGVDGDLAGAFGHPDVGDGVLAAAGGVVGGGGGHCEKRLFRYGGVSAVRLD